MRIYKARRNDTGMVADGLSGYDAAVCWVNPVDGTIVCDFDNAILDSFSGNRQHVGCREKGVHDSMGLIVGLWLNNSRVIQARLNLTKDRKSTRLNSSH